VRAWRQSEVDKSEDLNLNTWDTESLFEAIRAIFPSILESSTGTDSKRLIEIARLAFVSQGPGLPWGSDQEAYVTALLGGALSIEEFDWYEESAEALQSFAIAVYGGLMALHASGQIDEAGYSLGEAHVVGYILIHDVQLYKLYRER